MSRGFLSGVAAGAMVSVVGLAGLSVVTDMDHSPVQKPEEALDVTEAPVTPLDAPNEADETGAGEGLATAPSDDQPADMKAEDEVAQTSSEPEAGATDGKAPGTAPAASSEKPSDAAGAGDPSEETPEKPANEAIPDINTIDSGAAPEALEIPKVNGDSPSIAAADTDAPEVNTNAPAAPDGTQPDTTPVELPTGPAANVDDTAPESSSPKQDDPAKATELETRPKLPQILTPPANGSVLPKASDPQTEPPATQAQVAPEVTPDDAAPDIVEDSAPRIKSAPVAPIGDLAQNVTTNRLPSISTVPEAEKTEETPASAEGAAEAVTDSSPRAIERNAVAFTPVADRPLMAVLLKDEGGAREALGDISALPFPVTFVVDAMAADAAEAIAFYRAAGAEVVVEASLPPNSTPSDAEVNFQVQADVMDKATAVMMSGESGFQDDAALARQVAEILADSGHGVISQPKGLSTGHRLAIKAGVPAGLVFRDVDGAGQNGRAIRRFLDNAAFKARQQKGVIVFGRARPETLQALIEWSLGNRAKSVSVAPASAVLLGK